MKMNERGFFSLIGICFLLVAAILVVGLQESEGNYYDVTRNFYDEVDLQNVADSALIEAANKITSGEIELKMPPSQVSSRRYKQYPVPLNLHYDADVEVFYEYGNVRQKWREYESGNPKNDNDTKKNLARGVILISVASRDSDKMTGKIYRRSLGYFFEDDKQFRFMKSLINN